MNTNVSANDYDFVPRLHDRVSASPFYRSKFPDGLDHIEAFGSIPITTKAELRNASITDILAVDRALISHYHESSGTTGQPSSSWFTRNDIIRNAAQINLSGIRLQDTDMVLIRFPYALFLPAFLIQEASYQMNASIIHASSRNNVTTYPKILQLMSTLGVTIFAGLPRELELLAETARLLDYSIPAQFPSLRAIWVAGELLSPKRKLHLEQLWGVPVYNLFGSTETGNIAVMCEEGNLHYSEDEFYIEVLEEDHRSPKPTGERGRAIITTLQHEASPLLRYENGDIVSIQPSQCACGSSKHEIRHYGRLSERIEVHGQIIDSYDIQEAIYGLQPVPVAWRVKECKEDFELMLEFNNEEEADTSHIESYIKTQLGQGFRCTFVSENTLLNRAELLTVDAGRKPQYISKLDDSPEKTMFEEGKTLFLDGGYTKAMELFQEVIKRDAKHADAYAFQAACLGKMIEQGNLLSKVKLLPNLKRSAALAVQMNEFSPLARGVLGLMLLKTPEEFGGDVRRALKQFKLSLYLGSQDPDLWLYLTEANMKLNRISDAKEALQKALQLQPASKTALDLQKKLNKKG
ncbi:AMP-binding protein [Paenibacillus sp. NEAU-GSW1]|uniref:AMP-binding protein n=1 Tax=Paenibacillus sp. NEAU-GSW1 TaxID=2682486 RepID=UPI0012E15A23|nr:AMP-binding protein [Paenibacillus sp. NEAU-GSW1]MUT64893.1 AMP-binding protein [Paenibacillus sp. NEAU-GSW1]